MRRVFAVARLELREWRALPVATLALGCLPVLVWVGLRERLAFEWAHALLAHTTWNVAALMAGAAILAGDVRSGRASFLCARPLGPGTVWLGKLLAALAVTAGAALLCLLPGAVVAGRLDGTLRPSDAASIFWLVGLGQWGALAAAGRQRRLALDAAWAAFFLVSVAMYFDLSVEEGRLGAEAAALLRDALLGLPLLVASRAQAAEGDAERAYPVFSDAAAAVAALTLLGLVAVEILA